MRRVKQNGFILIIVVFILSLVGLAIILLSSSSAIMAFGSSTATLEADTGNLMASSLAWAQQNKDKLLELGENTSMQLDISSLGIRKAACEIAVKKIEDLALEIEISISCIRGKRRLVRNAGYIIR